MTGVQTCALPISRDRTVLEYDKLVQLEKQEVIVSGVDVDTDVAP